MQGVHKVKVFDSFTQQAVRFLFEAHESLWQQSPWIIEVQTILPDGSTETQSWFCESKGVLGFVRAAGLQTWKEISIFGHLTASCVMTTPGSYPSLDQESG